MQGIFFFTTVVVLVFGVLQIILFFKIWGMTNDVSRVRWILESQNKSADRKTNEEKNMKSNGISVGDLVVRLKDEKQMRVATIRDGKYECNTYGMSEGKWYDRDEIELFDVFYKK